MEDRSSRRVRILVTQLARSRLVRESGCMRADIHDGPEQMLQSEAGYIDARPHRQDRGNLLHRTAGPYIWVINRKAQVEHISSAFSDESRRSPAARNAALAASRLSAIPPFGPCDWIQGSESVRPTRKPKSKARQRADEVDHAGGVAARTVHATAA